MNKAIFLSALLIVLEVFQPVRPVQADPASSGQKKTLDVPDVRPFPDKRYHLERLSLARVLEKAGNFSPEILVVRKKLDISYADRIQAIETFIPSLTVSFGTMTYSGEVQNSRGIFYNIQKQQANMNHGVLLLDQPGLSAFQTIVRTTRIEQTRSQLSETINRKSTQAARLYFENLASLSRVAVLQEAVRISKRILDQEKKLMELGGASIVGVLRAAHEVARDSRHLVEEEKKTYRVAFRLSQIMGIDSETIPVPEESFILPRLYIRLPDEPDGLIELSDKKRPLLREYEKNLLARAQEFNGTLYAPLVPIVGANILNGSLGPDFNSLSCYNQTLFFALWTIGPGGLFDPAAIHLAQTREQHAEALLARNRLRVHRQVRYAYEQVRKSVEEEKIAVSDMSLAKMTFLASQRRVQLGVYHALELIISLRDLVDAQLHYIDSTRALEESQFNLLFSVGTRPRITEVPRPVGPVVDPNLFRFDVPSEKRAR